MEKLENVGTWVWDKDNPKQVNKKNHFHNFFFKNIMG
jgi:hypothetical protein